MITALLRTPQWLRSGAPANHRSTRVGTNPATRTAMLPGVGHGSGLGKVRWVIERGVASLHAFKRLRTRYERRADIHLGFLQLACALICHREVMKSFRNHL